MIFNAQKIFDELISKMDKFANDNVKSETDALIMAEVLMVKLKELFEGKGPGFQYKNQGK